MKNKFSVKTYFVTIGILVLQTAVRAQNKDHQWSVGPVASFKAIKSLVIYDFGVTASRSLSFGHRIRVEANYRTAGSNLEQNWGRIPMNMKTDIGSLIVGAGYDWFPFVSSGSHDLFLKSLKVIGGAWYVHKSEYNFNAGLRDPLVWGELTFTQEEIGEVATRIKTNRLQPFLGLGYDQFYLGNNINFNVNGGFLYQGKPKVTMVATNMLSPTVESAPRFERNLSSYNFSPFVQFVFQYNFK